MTDKRKHCAPTEDSPGDLERWVWSAGEIGVFIDKLTHAWQSVAWVPARSVTLRSLERPTSDDLAQIVALARLHDEPATTP